MRNLQLQHYLAIRDSFNTLPKSDFYNQVINSVFTALKMGDNNDLLDPFHTMHKLRIGHVMKHFIFYMNLISELSTFAFSLIMDDNDDEVVTNVQIYSIK